jgi:hypothetical protein
MVPMTKQVNNWYMNISHKMDKELCLMAKRELENGIYTTLSDILVMENICLKQHINDFLELVCEKGCPKDILLLILKRGGNPFLEATYRTGGLYEILQYRKPIWHIAMRKRNYHFFLWLMNQGEPITDPEAYLIFLRMAKLYCNWSYLAGCWYNTPAGKQELTYSDSRYDDGYKKGQEQNKNSGFL